jgi:phosphatidylethanolamine/phosphatidyl-N-methylethanolamine N-methyltransferase
VLEGTSLHVARKQNVNPLRFWALVECVNGKNGHEVETKHVNGVKNGNGAVAYSHLNGYRAAEPSSEQATA